MLSNLVDVLDCLGISEDQGFFLPWFYSMDRVSSFCLLSGPAGTFFCRPGAVYSQASTGESVDLVVKLFVPELADQVHPMLRRSMNVVAEYIVSCGTSLTGGRWLRKL